MRSGYFDLSWFLRAARVLPVIAGAALLGGMVGGFAVFAIDSALTWEPLTREPVSQPRPDARADSQTSAVVAQTKPVRIVGGAIPDPSAGMSAPPPAPQQRSAAPPAQSPAQISPQLLTPKPLGPASRLQTATAGPAAPQEQKQEQNQTTNQLPVPTQAVSITQQSTQQPTTQQRTRWPDVLSRAHQNAANAANAESANSAQQQAAPPHSSDRAASADDQDRANTFRHGRHGRRHWRGEDDAWASSSRRQDARSYDRLYDSYGNRRDRSYSNTREQPTATPEGIRMTPPRGPTCRAPRCGAPTCSASGATRAIKTGRSLKTTIAIRRPRQIVRGPSRSGAVAAFSAAAMRIRTTTKGSRPIRPRVASAICFYFLESTARRGPVRCARLRADGGPNRADSSVRRRRPQARRSQGKARWCR